MYRTSYRSLAVDFNIFSKTFVEQLFPQETILLIAEQAVNGLGKEPPETCCRSGKASATKLSAANSVRVTLLHEVGIQKRRLKVQNSTAFRLLFALKLIFGNRISVNISAALEMRL